MIYTIYPTLYTVYYSVLYRMEHNRIYRTQRNTVCCANHARERRKVQNVWVEWEERFYTPPPPGSNF